MTTSTTKPSKPRARRGKKPAAKRSQAPVILEAQGLRKYFQIDKRLGRPPTYLKAVDGIDLKLHKGEIFGLVGESGCGKTTLGKTLMGITRATAGKLVFEGRDIVNLTKSGYRQIRSRLQYVYQDPGASLDPRWKIKQSLAEPLIIHHREMTSADRRKMVKEAVRSVGLPEGHLELYPHELSGGQQRRIGLARILTLHPSLVILDEPTSGLDVSVQATILKLFLALQSEFDLTYLFISHDLAVVRMMCQRVGIMYLGKIVELGDTAEIFEDPKHPYTRSLLSAIPEPGGKRITTDFWLTGEPPDPADLPSGCRFRPRCPLVQDRCSVDEPELRNVGNNRTVACHFAE